MQGAKPLAWNNLSLPLPAGKGVGGMGAGKYAKGGVGRRQGRHAPCGHHSGGVSRRPAGQASAGYLLRRVSLCRFRFSRGDARGFAPCIRKQKNLPLPVGKGVRGMGAGKYAKGKADRQQKGKPPTVTTPSLPAFPYSRKVLRGPGDSFKSPPAFSPSAQENPRKINPIRLPREFLKKPLTNARRCGIIRPVMEA